MISPFSDVSKHLVAAPVAIAQPVVYSAAYHPAPVYHHHAVAPAFYNHHAYAPYLL
jgi:hypothetical protein